MADIDILKVHTGTLVAPAGVWLEAVGISGFAASGGPGPGEVYDPSFHEITFVWTVRNAPLAPYAAPGNMPPVWNDANLAYGKRVAFVFPQPGNYTIDLWAIDALGNIATAETTVTVADADTLYPGTRTVCFSNDPGETWAGEKPGCQRATSVAALQSIVGSATLPPRILLKRGQTVTDFHLFVDQGLLGYLGAWGTGARPVVRPAHRKHAVQTWDGALMPDLTIADMDFRGGWDSATETGIPDFSPTNFRINGADQIYTLHNCSIDGFQTVWPDGGSTRNYTAFIADCVITNWRDYGVYVSTRDVPGGRLAVVGSRITQHPDALNGGPKNGLYNTHGPFRGGCNSDTYLGVVDLFSRCGWSGLSPDTADQPCIRLNFDFKPDVRSVVERVVCEGGFEVVRMGGQNSTTSDLPGNYLFDKVLCIASAKSIAQFVKAEYGGVTFRNLLGVWPDVPLYHSGNGWQAGVTFRMDVPTSANQTAPVALYNSTFLSLWQPATDGGWSWAVAQGESAFFDNTVENNVAHAPTMDTPVTGDGPIDTAAAIPGVVTRYRGVRFGFQHQLHQLTASVATGASVTLGYPAGTDQAYWLALPGSDTRHMLDVSPVGLVFASRGEFSVAFEASQVRITNTSGATWPAGEYLQLKLDRSSMLPPVDATFGSADLSLPLPRPGAQSPALNGDAGMRAYDDFLGAVRPGPGGTDHRGDPRPATGNTRGALLGA